MKAKELVKNGIFYGLGIFVLVMFLLNQNKMKGENAYFFKAIDSNAVEFNLKSYEGKIIVMDFFGTWCPPCIKMIPSFVELSKEFNQNDVIFLGIHSVGNDPGNSYLKAFATKYKIDYKILHGTPDIEKKYQIESFPTLVIIDREGKIAHHMSGIHGKKQLHKIITNLLE
ncbi:TlpA family protein disulfide reductase [bacterium]|nr:TlpA family protein disulfide reductase [bacterium]